MGEAIALRRSSVNPLTSELRVTESATDVNGKLTFGTTKTGKARTVAIPDHVKHELEVHLRLNAEPQSNALVFTTPRGFPIRLSNFRRRIWAPAVVRADLPAALRIHDLRHTCASLLIDARASMKQTQEHLGHSSITETMDRYGHLFPEARQAVATALDDVIADAKTARDRTESNESGPEADQRWFTG
ncbi:MAG: tyrosine-type recombinase/integrase [Acidimicrobiia bacterium]